MLQRLAYERLVDVRLNRGATVAQPTVKDARDIFVARRIVECGVMPQVVARMTPALLAAAMQYRGALALAMLALSLGLLVVSWGLLRRREWGRLGFIAALVLGAVVNFAALLLVGPFFDSLQDLFPPGMADPASGWQIDAQLRMTRNLVMASGMIGALAIAGVHGWLVWKLCTAQVRAEFRRHGV